MVTSWNKSNVCSGTEQIFVSSSISLFFLHFSSGEKYQKWSSFHFTWSWNHSWVLEQFDLDRKRVRLFLRSPRVSGWRSWRFHHIDCNTFQVETYFAFSSCQNFFEAKDIQNGLDHLKKWVQKGSRFFFLFDFRLVFNYFLFRFERIQGGVILLTEVLGWFLDGIWYNGQHTQFRAVFQLCQWWLQLALAPSSETQYLMLTKCSPRMVSWWSGKRSSSSGPWKR